MTGSTQRTRALAAQIARGEASLGQSLDELPDDVDPGELEAELEGYQVLLAKGSPLLVGRCYLQMSFRSIRRDPGNTSALDRVEVEDQDHLMVRGRISRLAEMAELGGGTGLAGLLAADQPNSERRQWTFHAHLNSRRATGVFWPDLPTNTRNEDSFGALCLFPIASWDVMRGSYARYRPQVTLDLKPEAVMASTERGLIWAREEMVNPDWTVSDLVTSRLLSEGF